MPADYLSMLKKNLALIEEEIECASKKAQRSSDEICLVAVSKGQSFEKIKAAYALGLRNFGESYAQEFIAKKKEALKQGLTDIKWHFIGGIQSNKIKLIAEADFVHSIGRIDHVQALNNAAVHKIKFFLQLNLGQSSHRQGFLAEELAAAKERSEAFKNLELLGLMAILPLEPKKDPSFWFQNMVKIRNELGPGLKLSMGMSQDFSQAIIAGSHYIRVGEKLFGPRGDKPA